MHHTMRKSIGVPIDQALEKAYNKPAKGPGYDRISKKKRMGDKMDLKNTRKVNTPNLLMTCDYTDQHEYSLHHEFSDTITAAEEKSIQTKCEVLRG